MEVIFMNKEIFKANFKLISRFTKITDWAITKEMKQLALDIKSGKLECCEITSNELTYTDVLKCSDTMVATVLGIRVRYRKNTIHHEEGLLDAICYIFERLVRECDFNEKELEVLAILLEKEFKSEQELMTYLYCL
jgi:hypothetical protein